MARISFLLLSTSLLGCGAATAPPVGTEGEGEVVGSASLADDPSRARAFQGPLDLFARDLDRALAAAADGAEPDAEGVAIVFADPAALADQGLDGAQRIEVGEVSFVLRVVKDKGPPDSERWEQTSVEFTAVRAGGVFRLTALHSDFRLLASGPGPMTSDAPGLAGYRELRDALVEGFGGPNCRFLPRLATSDLNGIFDDDRVADAEPSMPDQARIDRICADWWDHTPPWRRLEVSRLSFYRVDRDRRVLASYDTTLAVREANLEVGAVSFAQ